MTSNDTVTPLRQAVEVSPNNVPLRILLADTLAGLNRFDEAQRELTTALSLDPDNTTVKVLLANTFFQLGLYMQALVIIEDLMKEPTPPAKAYLIHSRLLLNESQIQKAVQQYKHAIELDASLKDEMLSERLGVGQQANSHSEVSDGRLRAELEDMDSYDTELEKVKVKFSDVGGMESVKEQIRIKIIYPITNAEVYKAYGKKTGGGILMYGPPGCGKTHLARATAGEIDASFMNVGISDVLDMWIGNSEKNLHEVFEIARRNNPCVLFFDEVDALAASRNSMKSSARHVINQFLAELDGIESKNDGLLILAATNAPWHLDSAFRRPGRFDRIVFVPPPDKIARMEILRIMMQGKPSENIDFEHLAKRTENFSGADLHAVVDQTLEKKIEQAMREGKPKPITTKDLDSTIKDVKPSTAEWFATAKNYALYSNEGGAYDDIRKYMKL